MHMTSLLLLLDFLVMLSLGDQIGLRFTHGQAMIAEFLIVAGVEVIRATLDVHTAGIRLER